MSVLDVVSGYLGWIVFGIQFLFGVVLLFLKDKFPTKGEHADLVRNHELMQNVVDNLTLRTALVEKALSQLPDKEGMHKLELSMSALRGDLRSSEQRMKAFDDFSVRLQLQIDRVDEFLRRSTK